MRWYLIGAGWFVASVVFGLALGKVLAWLGRFDDV